jgi:hypothetical protein
MKLLGRSKSPETDDVRRVTGRPGEGDGVHPTPEVVATPVASRLQRLSGLVEGARRGRTDRNVRKIMQILGMLVIGFGFACIVLGWYGASHSPYLYQEIPYLISGGLLGVALVIGGGILVRCAWSLRQVEEERRNALAIVRSIDRLEKILRTVSQDGQLGETHTEGQA